MINTNNITPVLAHIKEGKTINRPSYLLRGRRLIIFRVLQIVSIVFGWGVMAWLIYHLIA